MLINSYALSEKDKEPMEEESQQQQEGRGPVQEVNTSQVGGSRSRF